MSNSTINLYVGTKLSVEKNFVVEDITFYLLPFTTITITDFQYIRPQSLDLTIKINRSQAYLTPTSANDIDYCRIQNSDSTKFYFYFVTNKVWKSANTIELTLRLDVLNTYTWNSDYVVDKKTLVTREHKDRVVNNELEEGVFERNIHLLSEGIIPPLYKSKENLIYQGNKNISWILYYRNRDDYDDSDPSAFTLNNPVECFIAPSSPVNSKYSTTNTTILASSLTSDGYYYIDANKWQLRVNGVDYGNYNAHWEIHKHNGVMDFRLCFIKKESKVVNAELVYYYIYNPRSNVASSQNSFDVINPIEDKVHYVYYSSSYYPDYGYPLPNPEESNLYFSISPTTIDFFLSADSIDRTDSRNIKIIELPYSPTSITYDRVNDVYLFDDSWVYDATQKLFKLKSLNIPFKSSFKAMTSSFWDGLVADIISPSSNDLRNDYFESKIYHSDFYKSKFVYDSFSLSFDYEKIDISKWFEKCQELGTTTLNIDFVASRNVISKFIFMFPQYITKYGTMDFDNVLPISRNNEQVIYNSQYLNYIRNGYNYDLKSRQRDIDTQGIGLGLSIASTIIGAVGGFASGNYAVGFGSLVAGGISIANQSVNYAKSIAQSEQNIQQKLQESRMQSVSVQNADDIDLLNAYCDNKAKWCLYEVSPTMKKALLDMFYYCGYSTQEQKVPNVNTRYWFNFLQCNLVVNHTNNIPSEIVDVIIARFSEGVTFLHRHTTWDIEQVKENYESWILE